MNGPRNKPPYESDDNDWNQCDDLGGTGHGDISWSDADSGL
jgi:hypothetical protein